MEPVFPLEVVSIILGHCGREELLRARLVCKDWNDLCLRHLAKTSHTLKLPYKKTKDFVNFLKKKGSRPVLPLELTIREDEEDDEPMPNPRQVVNMLRSLLAVTDPTCSIVLLDICKMYKARWINFHPFLKKISLGFRCLSLPVYFFKDVDMGETGAMITFPKLRILRLPLLADIKSKFNFNSSLMDRCPALEVLEIGKRLGTDAGDTQLRIPLQRVKSLCLYSISDPHTLLNQIRTAQGGTKLETFIWNNDNMYIHPSRRPGSPVLLELLQELAPNLRHFMHTINYSFYSSISHVSFPMLTRLDVIEVTLDQIRSRLNLNLCARMLPALTTLAIPIGQYLVAESELSTVRHLIIKARLTPLRREITPIDCKEFFSHLFGVCPNVKSVNMQASSSGPSAWISELLQCSSAVGIEELGVWNYTRDWIGETPIPAPQPESSRTTRSMAGRQLYQRPALSNVRKIRLSQKYDCDYATYYGKLPQVFDLDFSLGMPRHSNSEKRDRLHLTAIRKHFPNLRSLELSPCMLGSGYDSSYAAVRKIQSKYPDWKVDLIADDSELLPEVFKGPFDFR